MSSPALSLFPAAELKRILLTTDLSMSAESMAALPYVRSIAEQFGSAVYLWHCISPETEESTGLSLEANEQHARDKLESLTNTVQFQRLNVSPLVTNGDLATKLPQVIASQRVNLVVARTSGKRGLQRILYGSVVDEICRVARCPVLTVGPYLLPRREVMFKNIILPTDLSQHSLRVLPMVECLARRYGGAVTMLHVLPDGWQLRPDYKSVQESARKVMAHSVERLLSGFNCECICETGDPVETILRIASRKSADLIAMGVNNAFEPGIQMCPGVASRVVSEAHCPVLTSR
jgi:nucleotide-binding universal stress UspA family protein